MLFHQLATIKSSSKQSLSIQIEKQQLSLFSYKQEAASHQWPQLHTLKTLAPDAPNLFLLDKPINYQTQTLKLTISQKMEVGKLCIILITGMPMRPGNQNTCWKSKFTGFQHFHFNIIKPHFMLGGYEGWLSFVLESLKNWI